MTRFDSTVIAERVRDGVCVLECSLRDVHFATCPDFGKEKTDATCRGCAPSPAFTGSVICSRCFGRIRNLLRDAPDLLGRIRSLSDPTKAMQIAAVKISSRPVEAIAPVGPDLLDAADAILGNLRDWALVVRTGAMPVHSRLSGMDAVTAYRLAVEYSRMIITHLEQLTDSPRLALDLAEAVIVIHPEDAGERRAWSIADAADRWGVERRDRHVHPDVDAEPDREESAKPVREWYDPLLSVKDAAERHGLTTRAVRKWMTAGELPVAARARGPRGSVMLWAKASEVDRVAKLMEERRSPGRPVATCDDGSHG